MLDHLLLSWREMLDIGLVAFIYYRLILLIKGTRAVPVLYGLVLVLLLYYVSGEVGLFTLHWFLANFLGSIFLVVIILFQRDIRKALAEVGAGSFWRRAKVREEVLEEIWRALILMSRSRTGALVVIEGNVPLGDITDQGVEIGARVTRELLATVFYEGTPLHDGAVVVRGEKLAAAGCILPLAGSTELDSDLGTRHRAALGISEESDAVVLVVSEETGAISMAVSGQLIRGLSEETLFEKMKQAVNR